MELLNLNWYFEPPFDYEYKQYVLLGFLRNVEDSFINKKLSPYLLHLEKLKYEMERFQKGYDDLINSFNKKKYIYLENEDIVGLNENNINDIYEIVDFSIPQVKSKIIMGYKIFHKNKQLLY